MSTVLLASYDKDRGVDKPPTIEQLERAFQRGRTELPAHWAGLLTGLIQRMAFERALLTTAACYIPVDVASEDDPTEPPAWVAHVGDTLRAAGTPLESSEGGDVHWMLTADPTPPGQPKSDIPPHLRGVADAIERLDEPEKGLAKLGVHLQAWPRDENGSPIEAVRVGLGSRGEPILTVPTADRLGKLGLIDWTSGKATLTVQGRAAFAAFCAAVDSMPA